MSSKKYFGFQYVTPGKVTPIQYILIYQAYYFNSTFDKTCLITLFFVYDGTRLKSEDLHSSIKFKDNLALNSQMVLQLRVWERPIIRLSVTLHPSNFQISIVRMLNTDIFGLFQSEEKIEYTQRPLNGPIDRQQIIRVYDTTFAPIIFRLSIQYLRLIFFQLQIRKKKAKS